MSRAINLCAAAGGVDSQVYIAMEQCASQGALDAQGQSDHVREAKKLRESLCGRPRN